MSARWSFRVLFAVMISASACGLQAQSANRHIARVTLPLDIPSRALANPDEALRERLHRVAQAHLHSAGRSQADMVVFVDQDGNPILPDREAAKSARGTAANELTFTFTSTAYPWSREELFALNSAVAAFYPAIKAVYGPPAFRINVNIRKDPTLPFAGVYYPSLNEIALHDAGAADALCHEMIHAFRDDNIISLNTFEEGMARAAEVEVFNRLPEYNHWDENHGYTYDVYYDALNRQAIGSSAGRFTGGYVSSLLRYQLAGYAWGKALLENPNFLVNFNRLLHRRIQDDPSAVSTESTLINIAGMVQPAVEQKPFAVWYRQQAVLNTAPPAGYFLYQRINQFTVDFFRRDSSGFEAMQQYSPINWAVYDYNGALLASGSGTTTSYGWVDCNPYDLPAGYTGRIKVVVSASSPDGPVEDTAVRMIGEEAGVFGAVTDGIDGSITITPLERRGAPVTAAVTNGAFSIPTLASAKGRFVAVFQNSSGRRVSRTFTKDAGAYFLLMGS